MLIRLTSSLQMSKRIKWYMLLICFISCCSHVALTNRNVKKIQLIRKVQAKKKLAKTSN